MPMFVIERDISGLGGKSDAEFRAIATKSCDVLRGMGPQIQWLHSYVTDDRMYCIYIAPSPEEIREHARRGGFPADRISQVRRVVDPTTSEG